MISLEKASGLSIRMRDDYTLVFEGDLAPVKPLVREFSAMKNYLKDPFSTFGRREVYYIHRDIGMPNDLSAIHDAGLEYDLTVIPPGKMGDEFVKTVGHYHSYKTGTKVRYPEVYEVLHGEVFWVLQKSSEDLERLEEVYLVNATRGQKIVVPCGFGHVSVNPTDDVLVIANWQALKNQAIYEPYETHNGAAYYVTSSERLTKSGQTSADFKFAANLTYNHLPKLQRVVPRELPQYNLRSALPMYFTALQNLKSLDFLTSPERYVDELIPEKLFSFENS